MITRRTFLTALGLGASAAAVELVTPEPVRRFWQVGRGAPVGGPFNINSETYELWRGPCDADPEDLWHVVTDAGPYTPPQWLTPEQGFTYDGTATLYIPHGVSEARVVSVDTLRRTVTLGAEGDA